MKMIILLSPVMKEGLVADVAPAEAHLGDVTEEFLYFVQDKEL